MLSVNSRREAYQDTNALSLIVPPGIPTVTAIALIGVFGLSAIPASAPFLPMLSILVLALSVLALALARITKCGGETRTNIAGALLFVSFVAASLSESRHMVEAIGLTMPF